MSDLISQLNESQQKAVLQTQGPVMILAGAGSGKTRVIVYRLAHMIQQGINPFSILTLTFTNKAAREMRERVEKMLNSTEARGLWMGTFHSVFARILRAEAEKIGFPSNFTIYDTDDSKSLLKSIIKEMNLDDKQYKPSMIYNRISSSKNNLISWRQYLANEEIQREDQLSHKPLLGVIYKAYQERMFQSGAMDFDDILFNMNILIRDHADVLLKYQHKFKYIMVDEYQDTNFSQYIIVKKLASAHENICVVGDDAQSIYAFRGANIENILNFKSDYPELKVFKLEQNYRSTNMIVQAANSLISRNKNQFRKAVWTQNEEGHAISVSRAFTDNEEGQLVANSIFEIKHNQLAGNHEFAILYRTNAQSRAMEEALRKRNIPYRIYGGLSFYKRKEIKDLLAYFRLAINPKDEEALKRIINYPQRGIGDGTIEKVMVAASKKNISMWQVIEDPISAACDVNRNMAQKLANFSQLISSFRIIAGTLKAYDAAMHIADHSGLLKDLYNDRSPEGVSRYENVQELLNGVKEFSENDLADTGANPEPQQLSEEPRILASFMQDIALLTDADENDEDGKDKVSLMTIHAAKGLEFPYVYVVGLEEGLFPAMLSIDSLEGLEEERRLFYVALTRAEKRAMLSFATSRYRWGTLVSCEPSRFIREIDEKYLDYKFVSQGASPDFNDFLMDTDDPGTRFRLPKKANPVSSHTQVKTSPPKPYVPPARNLSRITADMTAKSSAEPGDDTRNLQAGMKVEHQRFGLGEVTLIEGSYPNQKATIAFEQAGTKQLILKFARLKILN